MKKFTKDEFNAIRNEIYSDLVIEKVMDDTDTNFMYLDSVLGRHLEVDWMEIDDNKIKLKAITIHWAEGDNSKYDNFPQTYSSYVATNDAIKPIYDDFISSGSGGYNKVKFTALFEDGERYEGKLCVCDGEDNPMTSDGNIIGKHIKDYLNWLQLNNLEIEKSVKFLNKYDLCKS